MGVSGRMSHSIEPKAGDLMMPERKRRPHAPRLRDVEDACFEPVNTSRSAFSERTSGADSGGVFKSQLTQSPALGPFPRDFAPPEGAASATVDRRERLGVFSGGRSSSATAQAKASMATSAFVLAFCAATAAIFWMANDRPPVQQPVATAQTLSAPTPAVSAPVVNDTATPAPDPVVTSAVRDKKAQPAGTGYTAPKPRPARIERAGSILMIRPGGG